MQWFDHRSCNGKEPGGVLELPEAATWPGVALELHIVISDGDRTMAYWVLDDGSFITEVEPGLA